jgi:hydroxypyruvate reductase
MPAPVEGVPLDALRAVTDELLASGAAIDEINAVRKHLSTIKGGQLARTAAPARVVGLLFSDVVGDDTSVIASGPTVPDPTTYGDALAVLDRYDVSAPDPVRAHLERGAAGAVPETPGPDSGAFDGVDTHVLANGTTALGAAAETATDRGYTPLVLSARMRGEARESATAHVAIAEECLASGQPVEPPAVLLSGGETTVTVRGDGTGGPNQEFALSAAIDLPGGAVLGSVDTDGLDGSTDAAGALVDADTVRDPDAARRALADNDAFPVLDERGALLVTGETGTNVNDLRALAVLE